MNKRNNFVDDEIPAHKKKSNKKGLPRADHKHIYETVLLTRNYHSNFGDSEYTLPTKVCVVCGRIGKTDSDESLCERQPELSVKRWAVWSKNLSKKALCLPKWHADYWEKFATKTVGVKKNDISISD